MPPVEEHEVHEKVKHEADYKYGCHNRMPFADVYIAPDRVYRADKLTWDDVRRPIQFTMSRECRYDMSLTDPRCTDCKHRGTGEAYAARVRADAK